MKCYIFKCNISSWQTLQDGCFFYCNYCSKIPNEAYSFNNPKTY